MTIQMTNGNVRFYAEVAWSTLGPKTLFILKPIHKMNVATSSTSCLHQQIAAAIVHNPHLNSRKIKVRTNRGQVILCGTAVSFFEKQMAQEALRKIDGITSIQNDLEVC